MKHDSPETTLPILQDQYGRIKRKLRISVTDRCNFKCTYCMPEHPEWMKKQDLLSFEALLVFCQYMVKQGIENIRITGGEPLVKKGVVDLISGCKEIGIKEIAMTTNGILLKDKIKELKERENASAGSFSRQD